MFASCEPHSKNRKSPVAASQSDSRRASIGWVSCGSPLAPLAPVAVEQCSTVATMQQHGRLSLLAEKASARLVRNESGPNIANALEWN